MLPVWQRRPRTWRKVVTRSPTSLPGYSGSEDSVAMETLLQGYDEQDEDQVYRVCNSPLLKYMDNDVSSSGMWLERNTAL